MAQACPVGPTLTDTTPDNVATCVGLAL